MTRCLAALSLAMVPLAIAVFDRAAFACVAVAWSCVGVNAWWDHVDCQGMYQSF